MKQKDIGLKATLPLLGACQPRSIITHRWHRWRILKALILIIYNVYILIFNINLQNIFHYELPKANHPQWSTDASVPQSLWVTWHGACFVPAATICPKVQHYRHNARSEWQLVVFWLSWSEGEVYWLGRPGLCIRKSDRCGLQRLFKVLPPFPCFVLPLSCPHSINVFPSHCTGWHQSYCHPWLLPLKSLLRPLKESRK